MKTNDMGAVASGPETVSAASPGGRRMADLIAEHDWAATPFGPRDGWPAELQTLVRLILASSQPMQICWGPHRGMIYNDAYARTLAMKHPAALGRDVLDVWQEIRHRIEPIVEQVLSGQPVLMNDLQLEIRRRGFPEETHFSFSHTPIFDERQQVLGFFGVSLETTGSVVAGREAAAERAQQRVILQHMPGFIAMLSGPDHRFDYVNDAFVDLAGARPFIGSRFRDVMADLEGQGYFEKLDEVCRTGEPIIVDALPIRFDRPDGLRVIDFVYHPVRDQAGHITGIFIGGEDVTQRVRAEERLIAERDRLQALLNGMDEGFMLLDQSMRCLDINREGLQIGGRTREGVVGQRLVDLLPGLEGRAGWRQLVEAMESRTILSQEHEWTMPDGQRRWIDLRAYPVDEGLAVFWRDISDRREVERHLRESEDRFRNMADHAPVIMWMKDAQNNITYLNRAWTEMTGQRQDQFTQGWLAAVHPGDRSRKSEVVNAALVAQKHYRVDYRLRRHDGAYRWVIDTAAPRFTSDGQFMGYVGTLIDIDERREAEDRAHIHAEELAAVFDAVPAAIMLTRDPDCRTITGNQLSAELLRLPNAESNMSRTGGAPGDIGHFRIFDASGNQIPDWDLPVQRAARGELIRSFEERILFDDGTVIDLIGNATPLRDANGQLRGAVAAFVDISARKRIEARLQELNQTLAQRVAEAVADREHVLAQLHEFQKLETIGQLTGGVAHDFNNLLTPIVGGLELVQRHVTGNQRLSRIVSAALASAERASVLVQRLLAFARRQTLQLRPVDPVQLLSGMHNLIAPSIGPTIAFSIDVPEDLPPALVDPNQLELALLNLAINARDAMPDGGNLRIEAEVAEVDPNQLVGLQPGSYLTIKVIDNGAGMSPDILSRAIEPFFSTKGVGKGTGLGLSMVHGMAAQSGGAFRLLSAPGQGTTAILWLPIAGGPVEDVAIAAEEMPAIKRSATVLLVDDEALVRASTAETLRDLGYSVIESGSAEQALALVEDGFRPDILVTDQIMPGMTGSAFANLLRRRIPNLPVLVISGYSSLSQSEMADLHLLAKPFRQVDLATAVANLLLQSEAQPQ